MLCQTCEGIFRGKFDKVNRQPHHGTVDSLYQALLVKCWICEQLWECLVTEYCYYHKPSEGISPEEKLSLVIKYVSMFSIYIQAALKD